MLETRDLRVLGIIIISKDLQVAVSFILSRSVHKNIQSRLSLPERDEWYETKIRYRMDTKMQRSDKTLRLRLSNKYIRGDASTNIQHTHTHTHFYGTGTLCVPKNLRWLRIFWNQSKFLLLAYQQVIWGALRLIGEFEIFLSPFACCVEIFIIRACVNTNLQIHPCHWAVRVLMKAFLEGITRETRLICLCYCLDDIDCNLDRCNVHDDMCLWFNK